MSDAKVTFRTKDGDCSTAPKPAYFSFECPNGNRCGMLMIAVGPHSVEHGTPRNGPNGCAQWDWDGNKETPTFTPSIDCKGCWHGYIRAGRCVNVSGQDEPGPMRKA